jgi:acetyltransferase
MESIKQMRLFMEPKSVAIVGASRSTSEEGSFNTLECLLEYGFPGPIYPINPGTEWVMGLRSYPSLLEVPGDIDLAVISLPRQAVLPSVQECVAKGIRAIIIVTQGFSDADEEGRALQQQIARAARAGGVRVLGPNTMGVINADARFSSAFVSLVKPEVKLPSLFIGQSGMAVYLGLLTRPLGIPWIGAKGIDVGNACDIDHADALEYGAHDPQTRVIAVHLEGLKEGRRFLEAAARAARRKPVLVLKVGTSEYGARAAASHTGAIVGQDQVYDAMLRQAGVMRVGDIEELEDLVKAFALLPPIRGRRIAILTPVGGLGVVCADACGQMGLELASFSPRTRQRLAALFPSWFSVVNPLDVWPAAFSATYNEVFRQVAEAVLQDEGVDGVVTVIWSSEDRYRFFEPILELQEVAARHRKPVACFLYGPNCQEGAMRLEASGGIAAYPSPGRAVRALAALWRYRQLQMRWWEREARLAVGE